MISTLLPRMGCPVCRGGGLRLEESTVRCCACPAEFPLRSGVLDFLPPDGGEVITPFQRIMQTPLVVLIYERFWRRLGYFVASGRPFDEEMTTILAWGRSAPPGPVLDLACGPGIFTRPLALRTSEAVVGLDLSLPMLHRAMLLVRRSSLGNVVLMRGSAFRLPFREGAFSLINCCGALHLFDDPRSALSEIRRTLRPGGCLTVQTTIRPLRSAGLAYLLERFIRFGFFDEPCLARLLSDSGFEIARSERHRVSISLLAQ